jgi:glycosyltransferase involved in cell wall biosynthesis
MRITRLVQYLPRVSSWRPVVLTLQDRAYAFLPRGSAPLLAELPPAVEVHRCATLEPRAGRLWRGLDYLPSPGGPRRGLGRLQELVQDYLMIPDVHLLWLPFALAAGWRLARRRRVRVILATCPPHSNALTAALLARLCRRPLVLDFRDDWVGEPWPAMGTANSPWAQGLQRRLERWAVEQAAVVLTATRRSLEAFRRRHPHLPPQRFRHLPNGCLPRFLAPGEQRPKPRRDRMLVVYGGSLGPTRDVVPFLRALFLLREAGHPLAGELQVVFAGGLTQQPRARVRDWGLEDMVQERPSLPPERFLELAAQADLLLALADPSRPTSLPGKLYPYWSSGVPTLLLAEEGAARDLVRAHALGYTAPPDRPVAIAVCLARLHRLWREGRLPAVDRGPLGGYYYPALAHRLAGILDQAAEGKGGVGLCG